MLSLPLTVLCINLEADIDRFEGAKERFEKYSFVNFCRSPGINTKNLPELCIRSLTRQNSIQRGTLGCFLAHVRAWEEIAAGSDWVLVVEDDCRPEELERLHKITIPSDGELIFVNGRGDPSYDLPRAAEATVVPACRLLNKMVLRPDVAAAAPGADGYLLSPAGARKLLEAVAIDGFAGHVDWRILRYCLALEDVRSASQGWLRSGHNPLSVERESGFLRGLVKGYCLSPAVIQLRPTTHSVRARLDKQGSSPQ